jgi:hypothetical protein
MTTTLATVPEVLNGTPNRKNCDVSSVDDVLDFLASLEQQHVEQQQIEQQQIVGEKRKREEKEEKKPKKTKIELDTIKPSLYVVENWSKRVCEHYILYYNSAICNILIRGESWHFHINESKKARKIFHCTLRKGTAENPETTSFSFTWWGEKGGWNTEPPAQHRHIMYELYRAFQHFGEEEKKQIVSIQKRAVAV